MSLFSPRARRVASLVLALPLSALPSLAATATAQPTPPAGGMRLDAAVADSFARAARARPRPTIPVIKGEGDGPAI
ncbi:hypothetical protein, partial [Gemmatimonas sp.]|uniref:hypothetical protein n=1 Tax=Gemmatimonas sp. TaxID=1962908 RepID=UPI003918FB6C